MIEVTVLGCGFMGRNHAHAISDHPILRLASVVDIDSEAAEAVADEFDAGKTLTDPERAIADAEAVIIATPESVHEAQATTALEYDRHLLLEKPLTVDTTAAWDLVDQAEKSDIVEGVSFVLRYDPGYAGVRNAVTDGDLGNPVAVRAKRAITRAESERVGTRGHPLYYMNIHDIDAMVWCVGSAVERVTAAERRGELAHLDIPDATHATLQFADGTIGTVVGYGVFPEDTPGGIDADFELIGTEGTAVVETPGTTLSLLAKGQYDRPDVRHWPVVNGRMDGAVRRQIGTFAAAISGDGEMLASLRDGARAQTIADAIRAALASKESVTVDSL